MRRRTIAVCGASGKITDAQDRLASELGAEVFCRGFNLACGGLDGIMAAVSRGFVQERGDQGNAGVVIGILPGSAHTPANGYCDIVLPTGIGYARNTLVVLAGDGVVLCGGGSGTLSEAAFAWQFGKPIASLAESGGWAAELAGRTLDHRYSEAIHRAKDAADAVGYLAGRFGLG